jgi:FlaA1/EpsC-like NDP-sugar epimerase
MFSKVMKASLPDRKTYEALGAFVMQRIPYKYMLLGAIPLSAAFSLWLSYQLRFDFDVPQVYVKQLWVALPIAAIIKLAVFYHLKGHSSDWRYVGLDDLLVIARHGLLCTAILASLPILLKPLLIPRGVIIADFFLTLVSLGALRVGGRILREVSLCNSDFRKPGESKTTDVIVIGAGDAGELLAREIKRNSRSGMKIEAFFDDDRTKWGTSVHGISVEGGVETIPAYVRRHSPKVAIIAAPSATGAQMSRIQNILRDLELKIKTLPPINEVIEHSDQLSQLRNVDIADLLGRREIQIDSRQINELITGQVVAVTGAGGSIGSEICRQILKRDPKKLLLVERSENSLFHVHRRLVEQCKPDSNAAIVPVLCDLRDRKRVASEFQNHKPNLVFHAAAHKHVAMQELNPCECFKNNVGGLKNIAHASAETGVEKFLLISTDKAVNPTSVMGATKRICEMYCLSLGHRTCTQFLAVRFGNVLASEGSVVPIFIEQISRGGPVTVTHPEVARYFMTIPEAVTLVLQAAALGQRGQIMILEMGEPIKIVDLAKRLIQLAGKESHTIPIAFTGLKPGEKLYEELSCSQEVCLQTSNHKIRMLKPEIDNPEQVYEKIDRIIESVWNRPGFMDVRRSIQELVPEYVPSATGAQAGVREARLSKVVSLASGA